MLEYGCYLLDLDGTVIDSLPVVFASFDHVLTTVIGLRKTREDVAACLGQPLRTMYVTLTAADLPTAPTPNTIEEWIQAHLEYQRTHWQGLVKLFDGADETLKFLKNKGKKLALVTSRAREPTEMFIKSLGIGGYFDIVITPEDTVQHKPQPGPALKALELLGMPACDALFIGDTAADLRCGASAGTHTCYVSYAKDQPYAWDDIFPTYSITNLRQLTHFKDHSAVTH